VCSCGNARRYLLFVAESFLGKHNPRVALEVPFESWQSEMTFQLQDLTVVRNSQLIRLCVIVSYTVVRNSQLIRLCVIVS
jgi:hypothetical protein